MSEFTKEIESIYGTQTSKIIAGMRFTDCEEVRLYGVVKWIEVEEYDNETGKWGEPENYYYVGYKVKPCNAKTLAKHIWDYYEEDGWQGAYKYKED